MLRQFLSALVARPAGAAAGGVRAAGSADRPVMPGVLHQVHGFAVLVDNTRPDIVTSAVLDRLREALDLISEYQPVRMHHLRRDVTRFWVTRYACRGAYFPGTRTIMTELTFLARRDITAAPVASSILHEGVHARVDVMGVAAHGRDRAREERLCRRAELAFGLALPPELGRPVVERARASLALDDADVAPVIDPRIAAVRIAEADRGS